MKGFVPCLRNFKHCWEVRGGGEEKIKELFVFVLWEGSFPYFLKIAKTKHQQATEELTGGSSLCN